MFAMSSETTSPAGAGAAAHRTGRKRIFSGKQPTDWSLHLGN